MVSGSKRDWISAKSTRRNKKTQGDEENGGWRGTQRLTRAGKRHGHRWQGSWRGVMSMPRSRGYDQYGRLQLMLEALGRQNCYFEQLIEGQINNGAHGQEFYEGRALGTKRPS